MHRSAPSAASHYNKSLSSPRLTTTTANFEKAVISFASPRNLISRIQSHVVVKIHKGLSTRRLAGTKREDGDGRLLGSLKKKRKRSSERKGREEGTREKAN